MSRVSDAVFLSPHLDDVALSCGGGVRRLADAGAAVTVVTVFTADLPQGSALSALARRSHLSWGLGRRPFAERSREDACALAALGAVAVHLGLLDAVYRTDETGRPLYCDFLPGSIAEHDRTVTLPALQQLVAREIEQRPEARVFCPSGIGGHADHLLVRCAAEAVCGHSSTLVYYEEYPYAAHHRAGDEGLPGARHVLAISERELDARLAAIACYESQLRGLFPTASERLLEIASARLPVIGPKLIPALDPANASARMRQVVRRDVDAMGGEAYRFDASAGAPFPALGEERRAEAAR